MRPETETQDKMLQTRPKTTPKVNLILTLIVIVIAMMMMMRLKESKHDIHISRVSYEEQQHPDVWTNIDKIFDTTQENETQMLHTKT